MSTTQNAQPPNNRLFTAIKAVVYRNYLQNIRNKRALVREFVFPFALLAVCCICFGGNTGTPPQKTNKIPNDSRKLQVLIVMRNTIPNSEEVKVLDYPSTSVASINTLVTLQKKSQLLLSPCTQASNDSSASAGDRLAANLGEVSSALEVKCFEEESDLETYAKKNFKRVLGGLVLGSNLTGLDGTDEVLSYRLRLDGDAQVAGGGTAPSVVETWVNGPSRAAKVWEDVYAPLQVGVEYSMAKTRAQRTGAAVPDGYWFSGVGLQEFPSPAYSDDESTDAMAGILPIYLVMIFSVQNRLFLQAILEDKENGAREALTVSGMSDFAYWGSWFVTAAVKTGAFTVLITLVSWAGRLFGSMDPTIAFVTFMLFVFTAAPFVLLVSSFFQSARVGGAVGMLVYILTALPGYILVAPSATPAARLGSSVMAPTAFFLSASLLNSAQAGAQDGLTWSRVGDPTVSPLGVSLLSLWGVMALDAVGYALLAWYVDKIVPDKHGAALPPWFVCEPRWCRAVCGRTDPAPQLVRGMSEDADDVEAGTPLVQGDERRELGVATPQVERVEPDIRRRPGIRIRDLTRVFRAARQPDVAAATAVQRRKARSQEDLPAESATSSWFGRCRRWCERGTAGELDSDALDILAARSRGDVIALRKLNLDLYQGQVLALLGHNGSGKSTTVNLLTGVMPCDQGDATLYGRSVRWDREGVRELVGVCPQHDVTLGQLTTREHLAVFAGIRGLSGPTAERAVQEVLRELGLASKADDLVDTLSGGQKRRLGVASALIGDPKVLFLDEPTSGCDAEARRAIWDVIERRKEGRVIVLTTHTMPEAEVLGDRVAILASGQLRVCGTSLFLKSRYGVGYHLSAAASRDCTPESVLQLVQDYVPLASFTRVSGAASSSTTPKKDTKSSGTASSSELLLTLPLSSTERFPDLLDALEDAKERLGLLGFGLTVSTLEEVFLKLTEAIEEEEAALEDSLLAETQSPPAGSDQLPTTTKQPTLTQPKKPKPPRAPHAALLGDLNEDDQEPISWMDQMQVMLWRRMLDAKRDRRGIFVKCILPLIFVGISIAFRSIADVDRTQSFASVTFSPKDQLEPGAPSSGSAKFPWTTASSPSSGPYQTVLNMLEVNVGWPAPSSKSGVPEPVLDSSARSASDLAQDLLDNRGYAPAAGFVTTPSAETWQLNLLYNTSYSNGVPTMLSMLSSALVRQSEVNTSFVGASPLLFQGTSQPWPRSISQNAGAAAAALLGSFISRMIMGLYIALGFASTPAIWAFSVVEERETKAKHLQFISGATSVSYWLSMWLWDSALFVIPTAGSAIILAIQGLFNGEQIGAICLLLICFGLALPGPVYCLSFAFDKAATAQTWTSLIFYITMLLMFFGSFVAEIPAILAGPVVRDVIRYVGSLFPGYALAKGIADIALAPLCNFADVLSGHPCTPTPVFSWDISGQKMVMLLASAPLWLGLLLWLEARTTPRPAPSSVSPVGPTMYVPQGGALTQGGMPSRMRRPEDEDEDVRAEREAVSRLRDEQGDGLPPVFVESLRKVFDRTATARLPLVAVDNLSIAVGRGEVLGLLGHNGAGKTTALRMLTGELTPTAGRIKLAGRDLSRERVGALGETGYCPQRDAIFPRLTGRETLTFFARLRGVKKAVIDRLVTEAIDHLDLKKYADQSSESYSGGNKRKLSTGVAYVGSPQIVFLDESSTGVDPGARRKLWEVIWARQSGRATVLTTHNLDEAAQLCSRIGIMVNGALVALGPPTRLRDRFSQGYQVELSAEEPEFLPTIIGDLARATGAKTLGNLCDIPLQPRATDPEHFVKILDTHGRHARVELSTAKSSHLGEIFRALLHHSSEKHLADFSCSEATLEQVFLRLTRDQRPEET